MNNKINKQKNTEKDTKKDTETNNKNLGGYPNLIKINDDELKKITFSKQIKSVQNLLSIQDILHF